MKIRYLLALILTLIASLAFAASASVVHVSLGKVSEIVLPEKVAKVIKGGAVDSVLVEVLEKSVYVLPKANQPADIFITGVSGTSYPINLVMGEEHDLRVDVQTDKKVVANAHGNLDPLDLMKILLRKEEPLGANLLKVGQRVQLKESNIGLKVDRIYDFPSMAAYIIKAHNPDRNNSILPLEQISFPNILAIAADEDMLMPEGLAGDTTTIYMIVGK